MKHIYFCSPSMPISLSENERNMGVKNLKKLGFDVTFSAHAFDNYGNTSSPIKTRVDDLMEGFLNPTYDIVATTIGGFNTNEILPFIDFELLQKYKKPFVGMSDITTLCVNLWQKSGIPTYYGMRFKNFYLSQDLNLYQNFVNTLTTDRFEGFYSGEMQQSDIIRHGNMKGQLIGGNLAILCWLAGTQFELKIPHGAILFLEDDDETNGYYWQMYLTHSKQLGVFDKVSGVVFGQVLKQTKFIGKSDFRSIINNVLGEYSFPIVVNADFGHIDFPRMIPYGIEYYLHV